MLWRADSLEKTLMLGKIEGWGRRGRQRMRWLDGITNSKKNSERWLYQNQTARGEQEDQELRMQISNKQPAGIINTNYIDISIKCKETAHSNLKQEMVAPDKKNYQIHVFKRSPLSMGFSRPWYWSGLPFPSPGDLPDPEIQAGSPTWQADSLPSEPPGKPF